MLSKRHSQIPYHSEAEKLEISDFYDFTSTYKESADVSGNDEDWEDVDDEEVVGSDEDEDADEELPQQVSYSDGVELHLPTGIKIGNRTLARYYRQSFRPETVLTEGQGTIIAAESRHLATVQDKKQLMEQKRIWKTERYGLDRDDRKAAKFINNQPYYRDQLLQ
jgi:pre-60S factor REI1